MTVVITEHNADCQAQALWICGFEAAKERDGGGDVSHSARTRRICRIAKVYVFGLSKLDIDDGAILNAVSADDF